MNRRPSGLLCLALIGCTHGSGGIATKADEGLVAGNAAAPDGIRTLVTRATAPLLRAAGTGKPAVTGLAVAVYSRGSSWTMRLGPTAPPEHGVFPVASITKPITGLLLSQLAADKLLDLDTAAIPCSELPNLCKTTTFRRLAQHTAGLPSVAPKRIGSYSAAAFGEYLRTVRPRGQGHRFNYSTVGFSLLGRCISSYMRQPYDQLVQRRILAPLGMTSSTFDSNNIPSAALVRGHGVDGVSLEARIPRSKVFAPSGGIYTSAEDLLRFLKAQLVPPDAKWAMANALQRKLDRSVPSFPGSRATLGWHYFGPLEAFWHSGHAAGHHGFIAFRVTTRVAVVLLADTATSPGDSRMAVAAFGLLAALPAGGNPTRARQP